MYLNLMRGSLLARAPLLFRPRAPLLFRPRAPLLFRPRALLCTQSTGSQWQQQVQRQDEVKGVQDEISGWQQQVQQQDEGKGGGTKVARRIYVIDENGVDCDMKIGTPPSATYPVLEEKDEIFYGLTEEEINAMTERERFIYVNERMIERIKKQLEVDTEISPGTRKRRESDLRDYNMCVMMAKKFGILVNIFG